jgi:hypothetical protein
MWTLYEEKQWGLAAVLIYQISSLSVRELLQHKSAVILALTILPPAVGIVARL